MLRLYDIGSRHPAKRESFYLGVRHEFPDRARFAGGEFMIELVKDYHAAARQTRPEMFETVNDYVVQTRIEIDELELHVSVGLEELIQVRAQVELMNMDDVIEALSGD